jgi:hypothetical protein
MTNERWRAEWEAALDVLEVDVETVEALIMSGHQMREHPLADPWTPPVGLGPLPLDLAPRADAILTRQLTATKVLATSIAVNRRQAEVMARIEVGHQGTPRPAYVDQAM